MANLSLDKAVYDILFDPTIIAMVINHLSNPNIDNMTIEQSAEIIAKGVDRDKIRQWFGRYKAHQDTIRRMSRSTEID